jgi:hypothetical protein
MACLSVPRPALRAVARPAAVQRRDGGERCRWREMNSTRGISLAPSEARCGSVHLAVDQAESFRSRKRARCASGDLRGIGRMGKHRFSVEHLADGDAVKAADQRFINPRFDRMGEAEFMQRAVGGLHLGVIQVPCWPRLSVLAQARMTPGNRCRGELRSAAVAQRLAQRARDLELDGKQHHARVGLHHRIGSPFEYHGKMPLQVGLRMRCGERSPPAQSSPFGSVRASSSGGKGRALKPGNHRAGPDGLRGNVSSVLKATTWSTSSRMPIVRRWRGCGARAPARGPRRRSLNAACTGTRRRERRVQDLRLHRALIVVNDVVGAQQYIDAATLAAVGAALHAFKWQGGDSSRPSSTSTRWPSSTVPGRKTPWPTKVGDEAIGRPVVQVVRRIPLLDLALGHDADLVGHGEGLVLVVRDENRRHAFLLQDGADFERQAFAQIDVEVGERFVEQDQFRARRQRAGQRHALLLAAGEFVRVFYALSGEPDGSPASSSTPRCAPALRRRAQAKGDVGGDVRCGKRA